MPVWSLWETWTYYFFPPPPQSQLSETFLDCSGSAGESYSHVRLLATRQHRNLQPSWPELSPTDETQAYYSVQWSQMTWWSVSLLVCVCLILLVWSSSSGLVSQDCLILAFEFSVCFFSRLSDFLIFSHSQVPRPFFVSFFFLCWHEDELVKNVLVASRKEDGVKKLWSNLQVYFFYILDSCKCRRSFHRTNLWDLIFHTNLDFFS